VSLQVPRGDRVRAGDVVASGTVYGTAVRVGGARHLGIAPDDLDRVLRVSPGAELERGAILARTGRRFARALSSPIAGRLAHVRADGDLLIAPIVDRWQVRSTLDGTVTRSDANVVVVTGAAWSLAGVAAYGPDAFGEIALAVDGAGDELAPSRVDVRQRGRILVGGGRTGPEAISRAHACGVAAVVAGAVPAGGLRAIYGDGVGAHGKPTREDVPTVLCLLGFGNAPLPEQLWRPFVAFAGTRAAIHVRSSRLFVFAPAAAAATDGAPPSLGLAADWGSVVSR
jgi:hypothetical protein